MSNKTEAIQSDGLISFGEKVGYSLGDAAFNLYWKTFEWFLIFFYTDVFGISAVVVGTMVLVMGLSSYVIDPVVGSIADRTKSRWGHFRPYLLWFALPLGVAGVLTFTTPNLSGDGKVVYAYITYCLLMLVYTVANIPYTALMGVMTPNSLERTSISSIRFIGAFTAGAFVQFFTLKFVNFFGHGNVQRGWQLTMVLYGILAVIMLMLCFTITRERVAPPKQQKSDIKRDIGGLFTSRPWLVMVGAILMVLAAFAIKGAATTYYFKYFVSIQGSSVASFAQHYFHRSVTWEDLVGLFMVSNGLAFLAAVSVATRVARKLGKKLLFILAIGGGGLVIGCFALPRPSDIGFMFALQILSSFVIGFNSPILFAMIADVADEAEWRTGRRATGLFFASASFSTKAGAAIGAAVFGALFHHFGYVANAVQTSISLHGIVMTMSWIPSGLMVAAALLVQLYPLTEAQMVKIEADLKARRGDVEA